MRLCRRSPASEKPLKTQWVHSPASTALIASKLYASHRWRACAPIIFCWQCGCYATCGRDGKLHQSTKKPLREQCKGQASKLQGSLWRFRKGHHPVSGKFVGPVARIFVSTHTSSFATASDSSNDSVPAKYAGARADAGSPSPCIACAGSI